MTETLAWLVDIPSETGNEETIRDAIADRLSDHPLTPIGRSLVVGIPGPGKAALVGHTDTVPLQGHVGARVDGERLHGLGATDMKGGLAVMIHLLEDHGTDRLVGVFYAGEEGPLTGNDLGPILEQMPALLESEAAFVMEPTNREVHAGCQGAVNAMVSFQGEAAHSARPWLGENAISKAGEFLSMMHSKEPDAREIDGLEFKEVMSVTRASGGIANNVIPASFALNVNYRFAPDRTLSEAISILESVCSPADAFEVVDAAPSAPPSIGHPLFESLIDNSGGVVKSKQGWTDVAQLAERGVPAINFGPGETALAHKPGESVDLADLDWAYEALARTLL